MQQAIRRAAGCRLWRCILILAASIALLAVAACGNPEIPPESNWQPPPPPDLTPGTVPEPQPVTTPYPAYVPSTGWLNDAGDQFHSHRSIVAGPGAADASWQFTAEGESYSPPVMAPDGTTYVTAGSTLLAFTTDGEIKWRGQLAAQSWSRAAVGADGRVYIGDRAGVLHAFSSSGELLWQHQLTMGTGSEGIIDTPPAIAPDGTIYVVQTGGMLHALTPEGAELWGCGAGFYSVLGVRALSDGSVLVAEEVYSDVDPAQLKSIRDGAKQWSYASPTRIDSLPVEGPGGSLYFFVVMDGDSALCVMSKDGQVLATQPAKLRLHGLEPYSIGQDGTLYAVDGADDVVAFAASGKLLWTRKYYDMNFTSAVTVGPDGNLYAVGYGNGSGNVLTCITPQGDQRFVQLAQFGDRDPQVAADGRIVVCSANYVYGFDQHGTRTWTHQLGNGFLENAVVDAAGNIYCSEGNVVHALSAAGKERWRKEFLPLQALDLVLAADGTLYVLAFSTLYAYAASGELRWSTTAGGLSNWFELQVGADGTLLVTAAYGRIAALHADGSLWWKHTPAHLQHASPAIDRQGNLYYLSEEWDYPDPDSSGSATWLSSWLTSLDRSGAQRWQVSLPKPLGGGLLVTADDGVVITDEDGKLSKYGGDGTVVWQCDLSQQGAYSLAESAAGELLVTQSLYRGWSPQASDDHQSRLYTLSADGVLQWQHDFGEFDAYAPLVDADGRSYVTTGRGQEILGGVYAFNAGGTQLFAQQLGSGSAFEAVFGAPLLTPDGTLLVPGADRLYAFGATP